MASPIVCAVELDLVNALCDPEMSYSLLLFMVDARDQAGDLYEGGRGHLELADRKESIFEDSFKHKSFHDAFVVLLGQRRKADPKDIDIGLDQALNDFLSQE